MGSELENVLLTSQVAARLGVSDRRVLQFANSGELSSRKLGPFFVFEREEVEAFAHKRAKNPSQMWLTRRANAERRAQQEQRSELSKA